MHFVSAADWESTSSWRGDVEDVEDEDVEDVDATGTRARKKERKEKREFANLSSFWPNFRAGFFGTPSRVQDSEPLAHVFSFFFFKEKSDFPNLHLDSYSWASGRRTPLEFPRDWIGISAANLRAESPHTQDKTESDFKNSAVNSAHKWLTLVQGCPDILGCSYLWQTPAGWTEK